jgi:hypothetical protein
LTPPPRKKKKAGARKPQPKPKPTIYNVHKCVLVGRSDYFRGLFRNNAQMAEKDRSTICLDGDEAEHLPLMLDYLYNPHHLQEEDFQLNFVGLYKLARYLGSKSHTKV